MEQVSSLITTSSTWIKTEGSQLFNKIITVTVNKHPFLSIVFVVFGLALSGRLFKSSYKFKKSFRKRRTESMGQGAIHTKQELVSHLLNVIETNQDCIKYVFNETDRAKYCFSELKDKSDEQYIKPYDDCALPISCNATISAPHMHATCLNALIDVFHDKSKNGQSINCLDVGSGSGFISAALGHLSEYYKLDGNILAIDHMQELAELGRNNVANDDNSCKFLSPSHPTRISFHQGDGNNKDLIVELWKKSFPSHQDQTPAQDQLFDVIHVGAASPILPQHLYELLKPNGRIVCPVGPSIGNQELLIIQRSVNSQQQNETQLVQVIAHVHFVPLFSSTDEQDRHFNRTIPRTMENEKGEKMTIYPYLHLVDNSITSLNDIKWE